MRYLILPVALLIINLAYGAVAGSKDNGPGKPNIVLIMADDMGYSDIGCYGGEINTPNIDKLAKEGVRFTRFYNNAWCSPSRASLITGLYPQQVGMTALAGPETGPPGPYQGYLNDRCVTLAEVLKGAGYYTAMAGKWHLGELQPHWPVDRGFDNYFGLISGAANYFDITKDKSPRVVRTMALDNKRYSPPKEGFFMTDAITGYALHVLDKQKTQSQPFFLYVAYTAPHFPLQAMPEDIAKYANEYDLGWDSLRAHRYQRLISLGIIKPGTKLTPRDAEVKPWAELPAKTRREMAQKMEVYAAQVDRMDQGIGRILAKLKETGKEENTVVIFLSDNGGCGEGGPDGFNRRDNGLPPGGVDSYMSYGQSWANASNTPFRFFKKWLHEGGISTPFIVRWPAKIQQQRRGQIMEQVGHVTDIMPTLCALSGAQYPAYYKNKKILPMEGQSLLPAIEKGTVKPHQPVFWFLDGHKAVLTGNDKLESVGNGAPWELYNIKEDRAELNDRAAGAPARVKDLAAQWENWATRAGISANNSTAQKKYIIYYGKHSTATERAVCADLKEDLEKVTGAPVTIAPEHGEVNAADYNFVVGTPATSLLVSRMVKNGVLQQKYLTPQGGVMKVVKENSAQMVLLAGATAEGMQNTVYAYSQSALGIDPLEYWTGRKPVKKPDFDPYKARDSIVASPLVPIICYFENDVDELANMRKPYLEYDMETWKGMVNSLRRIHYNAIHLFDMLGRPEFYTREPYKKLRPGYQVNLPLVDSMIAYAHLKGMKIQVDLSLGYQMKSVSDSEALCWSQYKDKWIDTWVYYLTKTPLGKADIYSLRPRNQVWDRAYISSCGENNAAVFNEVFTVIDSILAVYKPGVTKICVCYDDGMELFNTGFHPPKDFIVAWSDDGYCNFKTMPVSNKGYAFGTYMHAGFWTNHTVHDPYPLKIDSVMSYMLQRYNAGSYIAVNGQTFRPFLLNLEAFSRWAYDPAHFNGEAFYKSWTSYYFGAAAAPFAIASMKKLDDAHFNRTGYVKNLSEIKGLIGFLSDKAVETPNGSFKASYNNTLAPDLQRRHHDVTAAYNAAQSGLTAAKDHPVFYHDYVYLPALMYHQLLAFETTLLEAASRKQAYAAGHQKKDIREAKELIKTASQQLSAIYKTCRQGDRDSKWKTWYYPEKRRPNNGFPTLEMIAAIQNNLQTLSAK